MSNDSDTCANTHFQLVLLGISTQLDISKAGLAQSVERRTLNPVVEGSSPSFGDRFLLSFPFYDAHPCFYDQPCSSSMHMKHITTKFVLYMNSVRKIENCFYIL